MNLSLGLPNSLDKIGITKNQIMKSLLETEDLGKKKNRYTIVNNLNNTKEFFKKNLDQLMNQKIILN